MRTSASLPRSPVMLFALLLAGLVVLADPVSAQETDPGTLEGTVRSEEGVVVAGATVTAIRAGTGRTFGARAGDGGAFRIESLPPGTYRVRVRARGYRARVREEVAIRSGATTSLEVRLSIRPFELQEIRASVPGSGNESEFRRTYGRSKSESDVSASTTRGFNPVNNYDALRVVPGMNYLGGAGSRFGSPSRIRGASTWTISSVVEDLPAVSTAGIGTEDGGLAAGFGATIPGIALETIEVEKGSLGVLHGGNVDGGVIRNQIKRGHPGPARVSAFAETSRTDEWLAMADVSGGTETVDYYVAGKSMVGDYEDYVDESERALDEETFVSGVGRVGVNVSENLRVEGLTVWGRDRIHYAQPRDDDPTTAADESVTAPPNQFRTTNRNALYALTLDHDVSSSVGYEAGFTLYDVKAVRFSITEDLAHRDRPQRTETAFASAYVDTDLTDWLQYTAKVGGEASWHRQQEHAGGSDKEQTFTDRSVYLANSFVVDGRLSLDLGVRALDADDSWMAHDDLVHDVGAAYDLPATGTRLRMSHSTSYSRNRGFTFFFGPIDQAGGVRLSHNRTLEVGVEQALPAAGEQSGTLSITAYRQDNDDVPIFSGWGAGVVYTENRESQGLEVMTRYPVTGDLGLLASFAAMDTEVVSTTDPSGAGVGSTAVPVPRYTGALGVSGRVGDRLQFRVLGTYDDGRRNRTIDTQTGEVTVTTNEPFTRVTLSTDYALTRDIALRLRAENLLDQRDLGYSSKTILPDGSVERSDSEARVPGRFFSVGVSWSN